MTDPATSAYLVDYQKFKCLLRSQLDIFFFSGKWHDDRDMWFPYNAIDFKCAKRSFLFLKQNMINDKIKNIITVFIITPQKLRAFILYAIDYYY